MIPVVDEIDVARVSMSMVSTVRPDLHRRSLKQSDRRRDLVELHIGEIWGSTCLRWVFLSLRFFFVWIGCVVFFGFIWYFGALRFDDFAGFEKMVILRFF